ncbi:hypothetical protein JCM9534A_10000 [Catenuloplanes indicus JCM 9534]
MAPTSRAEVSARPAKSASASALAADVVRARYAPAPATSATLSSTANPRLNGRITAGPHHLFHTADPIGRTVAN